MSPPPYLVFFSRDPVDEQLAGAIVGGIRALGAMRAWGCPAPGWFDDPDAEAHERTTGGYLRVEDLGSEDAGALLAAVRRLSAQLEIVVEVQWRERTLGEIAAGSARGPVASLLGEAP